MTVTIGSLFTGYGGLDLAAEAILGARTVWTSDVDPGVSRILEHRFPDAPNLGDITAADWTTVEPVDIVTGGFPCQDVSHAGARAGLQPGNRSGLWARMADAIDQLRPQLVVAENVRGLLSAAADSDVEPCPWCMGGAADGEPPLRALGSVLADLADLGYDAAWHSVRASDVGAPHGRFRVFVLAWPADGTGAGEGVQRERRGDTPGDASAAAAPDAGRIRRDERRRAAAGDPEGGGTRGVAAGRSSVRTTADSGREGPGCGRAREDRQSSPHDDMGAPANADTSGDGRDEGRPEPAGLERGPDAAVLRASSADADGDRREERGEPEHAGVEGAPGGEPLGLGSDGRLWGAYEPAIRRWERTLGRSAPDPTEPSRSGAQRLSPRFVEWMMGLPDGWVTDVPGLTRNEQLKALGNGVVPQQAAAALTTLLVWRAAAVGEAIGV